MGFLRGNQAVNVTVDDVQSQLNATRVHCILRPTTLNDFEETLALARRSQRAISVAGGRHSMGGQQFGSDTIHLDTTGFNRLLDLDEQRGIATVEAGIQWPDLINELHKRQPNTVEPWTIREKQTGVDDVTLGGSLSSNVHGRGLKYPPLVGDIDSFELLDASGDLHHCSRVENPELFSLAIGGYGLFGIITQIRLRLVRRFKVRRRVEIIEVKDLLEWYERRLEQGFVLGDCQYSADLAGDAESHPGIFPCYQPVSLDTEITSHPVQLSAQDWADLYRMMRQDKRRAFEVYWEHYSKTEGQVYWSDTHQLAGDFVGHRAAVEPEKATEMISEGYLPHEKLMPFFRTIRQDLVERDADITYGTIRFIEADYETFLPWAREKSVCIVCNLHVRHTEAGIAKAKADFRKIIGRVVEFEGSFFLTYHRWATADQVLACYPKIRDFFRLKRIYDPTERFQSDWYRHYAPHFR